MRDFRSGFCQLKILSQASSLPISKMAGFFKTAWEDKAVLLKPLFNVACARIQGTMQLREEDKLLRSTAGRKKLYSTAKVWKLFCVTKFRSISGLRLRRLMCLNNF